MTKTATTNGSKRGETKEQYRLPGIEREGIAQLSLLETALWPLQGGTMPSHKFETSYSFTTLMGQRNADVTVWAPKGIQTVDEYILWGLLGATLSRHDPESSLLASPYWMLQHLGMATGGTQYAALRDSLLRLAVTSYQNTGFYNPETQEREYAAFQFLSILLPTVGGVGESVDNDRVWRIEWNPLFFRFCEATGGTLLFDLDLYRELTPASRRLFLKLKDRFWRNKRVFLNVEDLTVNGLGFSVTRPLKKRKFDLLGCMRELLDRGVIELGKRQTDPRDLFLKRGKGSYVVTFHEGEYFRHRESERTTGQKNAILDDPLYDPLLKIGVDGPGARRLLKNSRGSLIQRWLRITDAAMNEKPRGFAGFKVSPAAFLIDGIDHNRTPPDWYFDHERKREQEQWKMERSLVIDDTELRPRYEAERAAALKAYLSSPEGKQKYQQAYDVFLAVYQVQQPHRFREAADEAAKARTERLEFHFPDYGVWLEWHEDSLNHFL